MLRAHKIKLSPTPEQAAYFAKACGTARFSYNWALAEWRRQNLAGERPNEAKLRKALNSIKGDEFPWMAEVAKSAPQQAIKNLGEAYSRAFDRIKKGAKSRPKQNPYGFPQFKRKGHRDSFRADNGPDTTGSDAVQVSEETVKLPRCGRVRMMEALRFPGSIKSATVSRRADGWYVSLLVDTDQWLEIKPDSKPVVGVDLGIKSMAVLSDGVEFKNPNPLRTLLPRLKRASRAFSRKQKGSANRAKAKTKLARLHMRIADVRKDALHKATTKLATSYRVIGIDDLNVKGMVKNRRLSRAISDVGMAEFRRQLEYKAAMTGAQIVIVDRFFPSSKTCSSCGVIRDMPLAERWIRCECGNVMDRDMNAAINIRNYAASSAVSACGEEGSGSGRKTAAKPASAKQEPARAGERFLLSGA